MSQFKVLITDERFANLDREREILEAIGAEVIRSSQPYGNVNEDQLIEEARDADALLVCFAKITERLIDSLEHCKVIVRYGIGYDNIDVAAATKRGIIVCNIDDYCLSEVADQSVALAMCMYRKIMLSARKLRQGEWGIASLKPMHRAEKQVAGFIGFGRIARIAAVKMKAVGFTVIAFDPYLTQDVADGFGVELKSFEEVLGTSDIVMLHVPLMPSTARIINRESIALMKDGASLVNVSRGGLVDEEALIEALRSGKLAGAGLDVTEKEPIDMDNPLLAMDNVIVTPHTAWYSAESNADQQERAAQICADVLLGKTVRTIVNKEVLQG